MTEVKKKLQGDRDHRKPVESCQIDIKLRQSQSLHHSVSVNEFGNWSQQKR